MFCKMKDAILGCMGAKPDNEEPAPKGDHSQLLPRPQSTTSEKPGDRKKVRPTYLQLRELTRQQQQQEPKLGIQSRYRGGQYSTESSSISPASWRSHTPQSSSSRRRSSPRRRGQGQGQIRTCTDYDQGHIKAHYCKLYEKQYKRDLLKRQAARLPLLEYTYEDGKPLRGILKKPQFVRTPRMDEIIVVEVGAQCVVLHGYCCH